MKRTKYLRDYFLKTKIRGMFIWILLLIFTVALAFGYSYFFCQKVTVWENSMEPTLSAGDRVMTNRLVYKITTPKRGDLIVFRSSSDSEDVLRIKRIVGMPGETVQIKDGRILINGETYLEEKDFPSITNAGLAEAPVRLSGTEYFVLGDNRNASEDSRHVDVGTVARDNIVGRVWFRTSPSSRFGFVKK